MATKRSLEKLDDAELVGLLHEQDARIEDARAEKRRIAAVRDARLSEQYERERLAAAGFSPERIDAIADAGLLTVAGKGQGVNDG